MWCIRRDVARSMTVIHLIHDTAALVGVAAVTVLVAEPEVVVLPSIAGLTCICGP